MRASVFYAALVVLGFYTAFLTLVVLARGGNTETLVSRMRTSLKDVLGLAPGDVWSVTGVIATITVAVVVIVSTAGSRLSRSYAAWEETRTAAPHVRVEQQRASALFFLQFVLYLVTVVIATGAAVHGFWIATAVLVLLSGLLLVETYRFLQDVWSDPGVFAEDRLAAASQRLDRYSNADEDAPSAFLVWFATIALFLICMLAPIIRGRLAPTESMVLIIGILVIALMVIWLPALVLQSAESSLAGARVSLAVFAYVVFAASSGAIVFLTAFLWAEPSWPQFDGFGFFAALGLVGTELLRLLGIQDIGPLRAFSGASRLAIERLRDGIRKSIEARTSKVSPQQPLSLDSSRSAPFTVISSYEGRRERGGIVCCGTAARADTLGLHQGNEAVKRRRHAVG